MVASQEVKEIPGILATEDTNEGTHVKVAQEEESGDIPAPRSVNDIGGTVEIQRRDDLPDVLDGEVAGILVERTVAAHDQGCGADLVDVLMRQEGPGEMNH